MNKAAWTIIAVLLAVILLQRSCSNCPDAEPEYIVRTETIVEPGDTVVQVKEVKVPEPVYIKLPADTLIKYLQVDTAAILADYFAARKYEQVLKDDSSAFVQHNFTISRNRMTESSLMFQNRRAKTVIRQELRPVESNRWKLFGGISVGRKYTQFGIAPAVALLTKKDQLYSVQYDVINKDVYFSMYWKLKI